MEPVTEPPAPAAHPPRPPAPAGNRLPAPPANPPKAPAANGPPKAPAANGPPKAPAANGPPKAPAASGPPNAPAANGPPNAPAANGPPKAPAANGPPKAPAANGRTQPAPPLAPPPLAPPPLAPPPLAPPPPRYVRSPPPPLRGGPLAFLRFARAHNMIRPGYAVLIARWAWLKLRWRGRLRTDGLCFVCPGVKFEIGPDATVTLGRWSWLGHGTKVRAHEGSVTIGAKSVLGQECTISAYRHVSIGRDCIIADKVMMIDFDHGMVEVERTIREQGIYKREVRVGHNVWIGYGACLLRGVTVGDNSVIGTSAVVTSDVADNAIVGGIPARLIRMREAPKTFRWG